MKNKLTDINDTGESLISQKARDLQEKQENIENSKIEKRLYVVWDRVTDKTGSIMEGYSHQHAIRAVCQGKLPVGFESDYKLLYIGDKYSSGYIQGIIPEEIEFLPTYKMVNKE